MKINTKYRLYTIAGEKVLVMPGKEDELTTRVITFNSTSEWLWNRLAGSEFTREDVAALLMERFDVGSGQANADADGWIRQLKENFILEEE